MATSSSSSGWGGIAVAAAGGVLAAAHGLHAVSELSENLPAVVYGVGIPLLVSLLVVAGGIQLARRESELTDRRIVAWLAGGVAVGVVLVHLLISYQSAHGVVLDDLAFVYAINATYGAGLGLLGMNYEERVRLANVRLRRKARRLDDFASIVSHDLRNPLTVAVGHTELARESGDTSHLETVSEALDRMQTIVSDTLVLAKQGEEALEPGRVELRSVVREAWSMVDAEAATLAVTTDLVVWADRERLGAACRNLLRNAVEHNEGPVAITVGALPGDEGFFVEDDGTGIPPALGDRVFESGYSTDDGGTGLGLAIVRATCDAHDWAVRVTESAAGGARFEITGVDGAG